MGFYNIYTEGQQAEEYKARKDKEAEEKEKAEAERINRRLQAGVKTQNFEDEYYDGNPSARKDHNRAIDARRVVLRDEDKRATNWRNTPMRYTKQDYTDDRDAVNRHMRRHPDQWDGPNRVKSESYGIFESVELLDESWDVVDKSAEEVKHAQTDLEKTKQNAMSSISARHAELNSLLSRVESKSKNDSKEDQDKTSRKLADIGNMLNDLLKD